MNAAPTCLVCGEPIRAKRTGRPRKFCSARCRKSAQRAREEFRDIVVVATLSPAMSQISPAGLRGVADEFRDIALGGESPEHARGRPGAPEARRWRTQ
jgi:predicted nucleic acid-binding Zn ribbon protein